VGSSALYDCIVVGAGPAGLLAGTYLGRFRRRAIVIHDGESRARWIPRTRNVPGWPDGIAGADLLARLEAQLERYDVERIAGRVVAIEGKRGAFRLVEGTRTWQARRVILATGVHDVVPDDLRRLWPLVESGHVRLCPVCDAFELCGKRIGVLVRGRRCAGEAAFLSSYSASLVVFTHGEAPDAAVTRALQDQNVRLETAALAAVEAAGACLDVGLEDGRTVQVDALYIGFGVEVYSGLARRAGAQCDAEGYLLVDQRQQTSLPGVYAAGDVVQSLSQISVGFGQAAIAASAINVSLNEEGVRAAPPAGA